MHLDDLRSTEDLEALSERLWRRYGRRAFGMLDEIRKDPAMGEDIIETADYVRVELHLAADTEMVTKLEDFLRRRSKIAQVIPDSDVIGSPGLDEAVRILFGDRADEKLAEYLREREVPAMT
jgi:glycerol-3-phosphate dehydrogenase